MAYIYLSKEISLPEENETEAVNVAKKQLQAFYEELLSQHLPLLQQEVSRLNQEWTVEDSGFYSESVNCDDWQDGAWNANYMFCISIKSPNGDQDNNFEINEWDEWERLDKPMYKDVFEPLQKCKWEGFKQDNVIVEFSSIKVVESYKANQDFHVYNNQGWL
jgi:hypothetical protein